jgi:hypothetical protein
VGYEILPLNKLKHYHKIPHLEIHINIMSLKTKTEMTNSAKTNLLRNSE